MNNSLPSNFKFSWSSFTAYETCPLSFYHHYILGDWGPSNIHALVGCALHELIGHIYSVKNFNPKYAYFRWEYFLNRERNIRWKVRQYGHLTEKDLQSAKFIGFKYIKQFFIKINECGLVREIAFSELELKGSTYRNHPITVRIDGGFQTDQGFMIVDWKSGNVNPKYIHQLVFYSAVYQRQTGTKVDLVAPVYFDHPFVIHPITKQLKEETSKYIDKCYTGIKAGNFEPKKHQYCSDCLVRTKGKCPLWK